MSLLENHPRPSSRQKHRSSLPPLATMPLFQDQSSLSPQQRRHYHHHHHHHQGRRHTKHRLSNASTSSYTSVNSTSTSSTFMLTPRSFNNTFELVFTNLIDALIFTSAIAITAYNYWMGYIADPPRIYGSPTTTTTASPSKPSSPSVLLKPLDIPSPPLSVLSSPSSPTPATADASSKLDPTWSDLKRTPESVSSHKRLHSQENDAGPSLLPPPPPLLLQDEDEGEHEQEEQEERVNRMEETLQELIRQGQAALTSPIDWK